MDSTQSDLTSAEQTELSVSLVAAFVSNNSVPVGDLPGLLRSVHGAIVGLGRPVEAGPAEPQKPAVPVSKSITPDYLISLEDGRKLKSMKRYLAGLGMTPVEYRAKWGLPHDYPMVAASYSEKRSLMAKQAGLGKISSAGAA